MSLWRIAQGVHADARWRWSVSPVWREVQVDSGAIPPRIFVYLSNEVSPCRGLTVVWPTRDVFVFELRVLRDYMPICAGCFARTMVVLARRPGAAATTRRRSGGVDSGSTLRLSGGGSAGHRVVPAVTFTYTCGGAARARRPRRRRLGDDDPDLDRQAVRQSPPETSRKAFGCRRPGRRCTLQVVATEQGDEIGNSVSCVEGPRYADNNLTPVDRRSNL